MLAESVHQAVQGNVTRTNAALQALTAPGFRPEPISSRARRAADVLTFRVALALDPTATGGGPPAVAARPRQSAAQPLARAASAAGGEYPVVRSRRSGRAGHAVAEWARP